MRIATYLRKIKAYAESEKPLDHIVFAVNDAKSKIQLRIFNSEQGAKDVKGKIVWLNINMVKDPHKAYSSPYKKKREKLGRQTKVVDLEVYGALRRSMLTVQEGKKVIINIPNKEQNDISKYLETLYVQEIFNASKEEKEEAMALAKQLISEDLNELQNE